MNLHIAYLQTNIIKNKVKSSQTFLERPVVPKTECMNNLLSVLTNEKQKPLSTYSVDIAAIGTKVARKHP